MLPFSMKTPKGNELKKGGLGSELGPNWHNACINGAYWTITSVISTLGYHTYVKAI